MNKRRRKKAAKKLAEKEWTHTMLPVRLENITVAWGTEEEWDHLMDSIKSWAVAPIRPCIESQKIMSKMELTTKQRLEELAERGLLQPLVFQKTLIEPK